MHMYVAITITFTYNWYIFWLKHIKICDENFTSVFKENFGIIGCLKRHDISIFHLIYKKNIDMSSNILTQKQDYRKQYAWR